MKKLFLIVLLFIAKISFAQGLVNSKINTSNYPNTYPFPMNVMYYGPANFDPAKKYPLLVFGHGSGAAGTNISSLYAEDNLPHALQAGFVPPVDVVIVAVQSTSYTCQPEWLPSIFKQILPSIKIGANVYQIDTTKVFLTGLSAGGKMCYGSILNVPLDANIIPKIAGIIALDAATQDVIANYANIRPRWNNIPTWVVVGDQDGSYITPNQDIVSRIDSACSKCASFYFHAGYAHGGWGDIYTGHWKNPDGKTIWDFIAGIATQAVQAPNILPVAIAGSDTAIALPQNAWLLDGSKSFDSDGTIASYAWAGPGIIGQNKSGSQAMAYNLGVGTYTYSLTVTDNRGGSSTSQMKLTVTAAQVLLSPTDIIKITITKRDSTIITYP